MEAIADVESDIIEADETGKLSGGDAKALFDFVVFVRELAKEKKGMSIFIGELLHNMPSPKDKKAYFTDGQLEESQSQPSPEKFALTIHNGNDAATDAA